MNELIFAGMASLIIEPLTFEENVEKTLITRGEKLMPFIEKMREYIKENNIDISKFQIEDYVELLNKVKG